MNTFTIRLDLAKGTITEPVRLRQGDKNGTTIVAEIYDHGQRLSDTGLSAYVVIPNPDKEHYYRKAGTYTTGTVTVTINEAEAATVAGIVDNAYIELVRGSTLIATTQSFPVIIQPSAMDGAEPGETYDDAIQDAIDDLNDAIEAIPDTVEDVLEAHPEWTTTVQDGAVTDAKLYQGKGGILARNQRLMYRLDNLLTAALPEGDSATATDAAKTPLAGLALYGLSTQDGTPTPSSPVSIESVGGNLLPNNGSSTTSYGVTFTVNADGSVTCSGTATAQARFDIGRDVTTLPAGTYVCGEGTGSGYSIDVYKVVSGTATRIRGGFGTFTLDAETSIFVRIVVASGATVSATIRPYIYPGSVPYPYVPYGHAGLWARGKNLLNIPGWRSTVTAASGITCTVNADGSVALSGTASATSDVIDYSIGAGVPIAPLEPGSYVLTGCPANGSAATYGLIVRGVRADGTTKFYVYDTGSGVTVTLAEGEVIDRVYINVKSGVNMDGKTFYPMLRRAGTGAEFATYAETVTPIDLDGHELRSLPDGTRDELTVGADGRVTLVQRVGTATVSAVSWLSQGSIAYAALAGVRSGYFTDAVMSDHFGGGTGDGLCRVSGGNVLFVSSLFSDAATANAWFAANPTEVTYPLATPVTHDLGWTDAIPLCGPDLTAQAVPTAPFALTYERDLNATLARLEAALAALA